MGQHGSYRHTKHFFLEVCDFIDINILDKKYRAVQKYLFLLIILLNYYHQLAYILLGFYVTEQHNKVYNCRCGMHLN